MNIGKTEPFKLMTKYPYNALKRPKKSQIRYLRWQVPSLTPPSPSSIPILSNNGNDVTQQGLTGAHFLHLGINQPILCDTGEESFRLNIVTLFMNVPLTNRDVTKI